MLLLDQYVLKKFAVPFLYCIFGFVAIWFVWDLSTNLPDFVQGHMTLAMLFQFYKTQVPNVIVQSLPVGILLALLYSLTQMSRHNEIISILSSGRSLYRLFLPFFVVGLLLVGISTYFNYEQAPQAEARKNELKEEINNSAKTNKLITSHLFRNRMDNRTWYLQSLDVTHQSATELQIIQQDPEGNITEKWYVGSASFDPTTHTWTFNHVDHVVVDPNTTLMKFDIADQLQISDWSESPWRIGSSIMNPDLLGVPELKNYLYYNHDFPKTRLAPFLTHLYYRWALPWTCLIVMFLAGPLGIVYSRRSILSGVALAVLLFAGLLFLSNLCLALGKGARCAPWIAAWGPNLLFSGIAFFLLWVKATGRELPKIKWPGTN
jgi:LPS export ABC transporter permease LptG